MTKDCNTDLECTLSSGIVQEVAATSAVCTAVCALGGVSRTFTSQILSVSNATTEPPENCPACPTKMPLTDHKEDLKPMTTMTTTDAQSSMNSSSAPYYVIFFCVGFLVAVVGAVISFLVRQRCRLGEVSSEITDVQKEEKIKTSPQMIQVINL